MFIRLMPEQVSVYWESIKHAVEESLPPIVGETSDKLNNILMSLLSGSMDCWVSFRDVKIIAFAITSVTHDPCSDTKNLLLYVLYAYEKTMGADWIDGYQTLNKFAKALGCHRIVGYSDNKKVIEIAKKFGGDTSFTFISVPI